MAKKDVQDDVVGNKFNLLSARSSKLLSSWMGLAEPTTVRSPNDVSDARDEDADLKQADFGHDRLGVGSAIPKDIADGTFTRRAPTSNDKLLEQLIGKKRAKAHLAAKQDAERASARQQPAWQHKKEDKKVESSEDEEEGRAAMITSNRQKTNSVKPVLKRAAVEKDAAEDRNRRVEGDGNASEHSTIPADASAEQEPPREEGSDDDIDLKPKKRVKKNRAKPTSYLDELLAERSKKKKSRSKDVEET